MSKKQIFFLFLSLLLLTFSLLFKPLSIYFTQKYLSELFKTKVNVTEFSLFSLKAKATVDKTTNKFEIEYIKSNPLTFHAHYKGEIQAFKVYHPLKGESTLDAEIVYNKNLQIKVTTPLYDSNTTVFISNKDTQWLVDLNLSHLETKSFQTKNNFHLNIDGPLDAQMHLLYKETNLELILSLKHKLLTLKKADFTYNTQSGVFSLNSDITSNKLKKIDIALDGKNDENTTNILLNSHSFGGTLSLKYKNSKLLIDANNLHLSKIQERLHQKIVARGYINLKSQIDLKNSQGKFRLSSPWITLTSTNIKESLAVHGNFDFKDALIVHAQSKKFGSNISFYLKDKNYTLKAPNLQLDTILKGKLDLLLHGDFEKVHCKLKQTSRGEEFIVDADINFVNKLQINAKSSLFHSKTEFNYLNENFTLNASHLNIDEILLFLQKKPYIKGDVDLHLKGNKNKVNFKIVSNFLKNEIFKLTGELKLDETLTLFAKSNNFHSKSELYLKDKHIEFSSKNLNIEKLLQAFNINNDLKGDVELRFSGTQEHIKAQLKSTNLLHKSAYMGLNNNTLVSLNIDYQPKKVSIDTYLKNKKILVKNLHTDYLLENKVLKNSGNIILYDDIQVIDIDLKTKSQLTPPYNTQADISTKNDTIKIKNFAYEDGEIKSSFAINIAELHHYKALIGVELFGELEVLGEYSNALNISSKSLGGTLNIRFKKDLLTARLNNLKLSKIAKYFGKEKLLTKGDISGVLLYNKKSKNAKTDIYMKDITLQGVDIDQTLSTLKNSMGLNILALGKDSYKNYNKKELKTDIQYLQFTTHLKNRLLSLDDVALKTKNFRIAALGAIKQDGAIDRLDIHILSREGCSALMQNFEGNIKDPKLKSTSSALIDIASGIPSSLLNTTQKILNFGTNVVDKTASYTFKTTHISDANISLTKNVLERGTSVLKTTTNVVNVTQCKVVYNGKVKPPTLNK